jgi:cytidine deaminase
MEMACRQVIAQSSAGDCKICEDLSNGKNMVFNMKELLNVGMDPTPWQRGGKKRWEQAE